MADRDDAGATALPAPPADRSPTVAASPAPDVRSAVAVAVGGGVLLAGALAVTGAAAWALLAVAAMALATSLWVEFSGEEVWLGDDWVAARGLLPALVIDAADVAKVDWPLTDLGPGDLVIARRRYGLIRLAPERLAGAPELGRAVAAFVGRAEAWGATVTPAARRLLEDILR